MTSKCTVGDACKLLKSSILCPSKYVDLRGTSGINNWHTNGRWTSVSQHIAIAEFSSLDDDKDDASCRRARREADVHVCGAKGSGPFFGLVRLEKYAGGVLSDDLWVKVIPTDASADDLRTAMNAQDLVQRAVSSGKPTEKLALLDAVHGTGNDPTKRIYAEVLTSAGFDFAALAAEEPALRAQVASTSPPASASSRGEAGTGDSGASPGEPWPDASALPDDWSPFRFLSGSELTAELAAEKDKLKESKPATWQSQWSEDSARIKSEWASEAAKTKKTIYWTTVPAVVGQYDTKRQGFPVTLKSPVSLPESGSVSRALALDGSPIVGRAAKEIEGASEPGVREFEYHFGGGQSRSWFVPVAAADADTFAKENDALVARLAFTVSSALFDANGEPKYSVAAGVNGPGADVLKDMKSGPGDALGAAIVRWRLEAKDGHAVLLSDAKK